MYWVPGRWMAVCLASRNVPREHQALIFQLGQVGTVMAVNRAHMSSPDERVCLYECQVALSRVQAVE